MIKTLILTFSILLFSASISLADGKLREVQQILNKWHLEAGPNDGAWGDKTEAALRRFLEHRGTEFDGNFSQNEYEEVIGLQKIKKPQTDGFSLRPVGWRLPGKDSYSLSVDNPREFTLRLFPNDFDPVFYKPVQDRTNVYSSAKDLNFKKQRAELTTEKFPIGQTYTLDFEMRVSDPSAGSVMQIHGARGGIDLRAFPDALRVNIIGGVDNKALIRGDWLNEWQNIRVVFRPATGSNGWYKYYVNGELKLDTTGLRNDFAYSKKEGFWLSFGLYRGLSSRTAEVTYRNLVLSRKDLSK